MSSYNPMGTAKDVASVNVGSVAHSAKDVAITMLGTEIPYWKSINYSGTEDNGFDVGGSAQYGHYQGKGTRTYSGNIEVSTEELMKMANAVLVGNFKEIFDIPPFDILITFFSQIGQIRTVILHNVMFDNYSGTVTEGDLYTYAQLTFKYQAQTNDA